MQFFIFMVAGMPALHEISMSAQCRIIMTININIAKTIIHFPFH